jgi:heptosyltransferase-1
VARSFRRILLVRLREIGDVVFTTPAVAALRGRYADAEITYLVEPAAAPAVKGNPHLDNVIVAARGGVAADLALGLELRRSRFDLAIDFHGGPRASLLTWLSGASERVGYEIVGRSWMYTRRVARPRELRARHSVENQWDLLRALGFEEPTRSTYPVQMATSQAVARNVTERLRRAGVTDEHQLILIHVSAGNPFRRWPREHFANLVTSLAEGNPNRRVVLTAGPSDQLASERVAEDARGRLGTATGQRVITCGEFSLEELRALADCASLYIGGDSGPMHIAATSRVPIVGLYGPTLSARSAPWRDSLLVHEAVEVGGLPCRPCDQRVCAPGDFRCLTSIAPADVAAAAERALARAGCDRPSTEQYRSEVR